MKPTQTSIDLWNEVVNFYEEKLGIPQHIVNYLAVDEALRLCVSGLNNGKIASLLRYEYQSYVDDITREFLDFAGWYRDLDVNPWHIYRRQKDYYGFRTEYSLLTKVDNYDIIDKAYDLCKKYEIIRKEIDKYYEPK